jgi:hypothetical protein
MAYRILTVAALTVALAGPALAETTTYTTTTSCSYSSGRTSSRGASSDCTTETKVQRPDPPPKPNCGYLPNFGGVNPRCNQQ